MDKFLECIEKYELLLELILTATSLLISVLVVIQTKNLAKRQAKQEKSIADQQNDLQKRQIRLELFERKLQINNVLTQIFSFARKLKTICEIDKIRFLNTDKQNELFEMIKEDIDENEIEKIMQQAKFIISKDKYIHIVNVHSFFFFIICRLWGFKNDSISKKSDIKENEIQENIETVISYCDEIIKLEEFIIKIMDEELNIVRIDK